MSRHSYTPGRRTWPSSAGGALSLRAPRQISQSRLAYIRAPHLHNALPSSLELLSR
uniref:Uncharacterized protein n=1 Tax=Arundo donax TaxID=35708 RepID=A0A0A9HH12_ARUDO